MKPGDNQVTVYISQSCSDPDGGGSPLQIQTVEPDPEFGSATSNIFEGSITYAPTAHFGEQHSVSFVVVDRQGGSFAGVFRINTPPLPSASDFAEAFLPGETKQINVAVRGSVSPLSALSLFVYTSSQHGVSVQQQGWEIQYSLPVNPTFTEDLIKYEVDYVGSDGRTKVTRFIRVSVPPPTPSAPNTGTNTETPTSPTTEVPPTSDPATNTDTPTQQPVTDTPNVTLTSAEILTVDAPTQEPTLAVVDTITPEQPPPTDTVAP